MRLARYFGTSAAVWLWMQARYDLEVAEDQMGKRVEREVKTLKRSRPAQEIASTSCGRLAMTV